MHSLHQNQFDIDSNLDSGLHEQHSHDAIPPLPFHYPVMFEWNIGRLVFLSGGKNRSQNEDASDTSMREKSFRSFASIFIEEKEKEENTCSDFCVSWDMYLWLVKLLNNVSMQSS